MRRRRFYGFNSTDDVRSHVGQIKTEADLMQLRYDIQQANCNLTYFESGFDGVYRVDCLAGDHPESHVFMTQSAYQRYGGLTEAELQQVTTFTVLQ